MKSITFRPLRRIKKTGKITVASYMQWRKVKSADYGKFNLVIDNSYSAMNPEGYVYDHKGEQLFWYNHQNPEALPKNYFDLESAVKIFGEQTRDHLEGEMYKLTEPIGIGFHHSIHGFDCDGVPVFSHYTADYIATHCTDVNQFEPLTVAMVTKWFGWFLLELQNSYLQIDN